MKKRYISPATEVIELSAGQMLLAGSSIPISSGTTGTVDVRELEGFDELGNFEDLMKQMGM